MNHRNYQKELDTILEDFEKQGKVPRLLLHSCCAPCSSYVLEYLSKYFEITLYYYNPNIYPLQEYMKRVKEQEKLISEMKLAHPTTLTISPLKNAEKLNEIGEKLAKEYRVAYLPSDFKKKDGYKRSVQLSEEYGLYRQDYCGCVYSKEAGQAQ